MVPVGLDVSAPAVYEFSLYQENLDGSSIVLEDRMENTLTNLMQATYFASISQSGTGRYYLHFKDATAMGEITPHTKIICSYTDGNIYIHNPDGESGELSLINITGQALSRSVLSGIETQMLSVTQPGGIYIIDIRTDASKISKIFFVIF
nr:T9SS type A sorting domain-containing protein [Bacteroidota bacterium]